MLFGNIAPDGAVIKISALDADIQQMTCTARVFDAQQDALESILSGQIKPGDAVVIRYEGPAGSGMPEQFYVTEAIASNPMLSRTTMLITDGRFSGATRGPAIGHVAPEAARGGPIALVQEGDLIHVDLLQNAVNIIGESGVALASSEVAELLEARRQHWQRPRPKYQTGLLAMYTQCALPAHQGGGIASVI